MTKLRGWNVHDGQGQRIMRHAARALVQGLAAPLLLIVCQRLPEHAELLRHRCDRHFGTGLPRRCHMRLCLFPLLGAEQEIG